MHKRLQRTACGLVAGAGLALAAPLSSAATATGPALDISGFARVVGGYLDDSHARYEGYADRISVSEDSLLGLQGDLRLTESLSLTSQLLAHSGDDRDSGVEWLYASYQPQESVKIRLGQMRTPFFNLSDVLDVGFAYPYIMPPQQVYNGFLFDQYRGISLTLNSSWQNFRTGLEVYTGYFDGDTIVAAYEIPTEVEDIVGVVATLGYSNVEWRSSFFSGRVDLTIPEVDTLTRTLTRLGFSRSAATLESAGRTSALQSALAYDGLRYFARAEYIHLSSDFAVVPDTHSRYVTLGINLPPVTLHITAASSDVSYDTIRHDIPLGLDPGLDSLATSFDRVRAILPSDDLTSLSLGARWELSSNLALKAEATRLDGERNQRSFFEIDAGESDAFDRKAMLYAVAVEWVF